MENILNSGDLSFLLHLSLFVAGEQQYLQTPWRPLGAIVWTGISFSTVDILWASRWLCPQKTHTPTLSLMRALFLNLPHTAGPLMWVCVIKWTKGRNLIYGTSSCCHLWKAAVRLDVRSMSKSSCASISCWAHSQMFSCFVLFFLLNIVKEKKNITVWLNMTKALKHLENKT